MGRSSSTESVGDRSSTDIEDAGTWPNFLNVAFGVGLFGVGFVLGGPLLERLDAVVVGSLVVVLGGLNLYQTEKGYLEHPDVVRGIALLGLWVVAFSLNEGPTSLSLLADTVLALGALILVVNIVDFVRQFKSRPGKRRRARNHAPTVWPDPIAGLSKRTDLAEWPGSPGVALGSIGTGTAHPFTRVLDTVTDGTVVRLSPTEHLSAGGLRPSLREPRGLLHGATRSRYPLPLLLAVPVGIGAGVGAAVFRLLMFLVHSFLFGVVLPRLPSHLFLPVLPLVGAGIAGVLIYELAPEAAGHGVPENMEAIAESGGRIRHRLAPFKVLVSALVLGSGGSGGREGPIARIGAGVGSSLAQIFGLCEENARLLLAAGIAGGIGATFGAPVGGIFFVVECVMMYKVTLFNLLVLAETTVVGVGTADMIAPRVEWFSFLPFPLPELAVTPSDILYVLPYGLVIGVLAWVWVMLLDRTERLFDGLAIPDDVKPALGAIPVGVLGIWYAKYGVMGVGYDGLRLAVTDVKMGGLLLLVLAASKLVATQFTIGSGGSGGVFAPTLYIGGLLAVGLHHFLGMLPVSAGLLGVIGMGAIFSGAAFAPLTGMFLVAEMFGSYELVAVLAVPCLVSYAITRTLCSVSIYTSRLQRKGILADYPEKATQIGPAPDDDS